MAHHTYQTIQTQILRKTRVLEYGDKYEADPTHVQQIKQAAMREADLIDAINDAIRELRYEIFADADDAGEPDA